MQYLSDIFKYTQGLGQKGHQIGRKVGDAIELITLGMIDLEDNLSRFLVIEDGVEGATTAKHKVEFSFYNLNNRQLPSKRSTDLFGIIECKKVGVEVTIKQNFKKWKSQNRNRPFHQTSGYSFGISPRDIPEKWDIKIINTNEDGNNLKVQVTGMQQGLPIITTFLFRVRENDNIIIALDSENELFVLGPDNNLTELQNHLSKCIIVSIRRVSANGVEDIKVEDSLPGPQTPEKAKQASFVSLDVRKKVLGRFDKTDDKSFISILVIGEASHWEEKSRSMVRLCNDYNLIVPDEVIVYLFERFDDEFGENHQDMITKTKYRSVPDVKRLVNEVIEHFERRVLYEMEFEDFVVFKHQVQDNSNRLVIEEFSEDNVL